MKKSFFIIVLALIAPAIVRAQGDIRRIDFKNFSYSPACIEKNEKLRARNGEYTRGTPGDPASDMVYFKVGEVVYGDLTGDGAEEAVVVTLCNTGGTGQFTDGIIFTMRGGNAVEILSLGVGDRAYGGIDSVAIENGLLKVGRYGTLSGGACCPEYIETTTYRLTGGKLVQVGKPVRKKVEPDAPAPEAKRIRFARGRTSAVLTGSTDSSDEYLLGARAGQTMLVHVTSKGNNAAVEVLDWDGNAVEGAAKADDWSGVLPKNGDYKIIVRSTKGAAVYTLEVTIR
ncbi:MAG: hypothetical protein AB1631_19640 [Acidobacteriota bacterium]